MALEIRKEEGSSMDMVTVDRHLYLTEDQSRVVEENDPAGRWLWAGPGAEVSRAEAERLGALRPEPKAVEAPADKQAGKPADKSAGKPVDKSTDDSVEDLRARAEAAGVTVDKRWGVDRLRQEIEQAED